MGYWLKSTAAILASLVFVGICVWFSGAVYKVAYLQEPAYTVPGVDESGVDLPAVHRNWPAGLSLAERARLVGHMRAIRANYGTAAEEAVPEEDLDFTTLLSRADPARGERAAAICGACHSFAEGEAARIGPNLWDVVGRNVATSGGFAYSNAMTAEDGEWSLERLDTFLMAPADAVPGTTMTFAGVADGAARADVIAYLTTLSNNPVALPEPAGPLPQDVAAEAAAPAADLATRLAQADATDGESDARICAACHSLVSGEPARIGPNLWNIVGRDIGNAEGFGYSEAMSGRDGNWSYDELDEFLAAPGAIVPGTTMTFAGVADAAERADVIAYLRTLNDDPPPLPEPAAAP